MNETKTVNCIEEIKNVLILEPFYTGSHRELIDLLCSELEKKIHKLQVNLVTMSGKKWHWRARTSALYMSENIPCKNYYSIFASSVLPLHELLALRPDLRKCKKIIYFHENQLVYPVRKNQKERDFQYGYNQIMSCLVADSVIFNSHYNQDSFLSSIKNYFKLQPDYRPKNLKEKIYSKCSVVYFPLDYEKIDNTLKIALDQFPKLFKDEKFSESENNANIYSILWPHRWEFDKNPEAFFQILFKLVEENVTNFKIFVLGQTFTQFPEIFNEAKNKLHDHIAHFGYLESKDEYYKFLSQSDIVVSTANHEFFGVAMIESVYLGAFPLCPNRLSYPEIFKSSQYLYDDDSHLFLKLKNILNSPKNQFISQRIKEKEIEKKYLKNYDWKNLRDQFIYLLSS